MGGKRLKAATRNSAANHRLCCFSTTLQKHGKATFYGTFFQNHILVVKAIDAFFHSSMIFMLQ